MCWSAEEVFCGVHDEVSGAAVAQGDAASLDDCDGASFKLAGDELCGGGELIGFGDYGDL